MAASHLPHLGALFDDDESDEALVSRLWLKLRIEHANGAFETVAGQVGGSDIELVAPGGGRALAKGDIALVMLIANPGRAIAARVLSSEPSGAGRRVTMRLSASILALLAA